MARSGLVAALLALIAITSPRALVAAEPSTHDAARTAYDRGLEAHRRGDYAAAAAELARADELEPNAVALEAALKAALLADDPLLGMALAARADVRFAPPAPAAPASLAKVLDDARSQFRGRTARLLLQCASCTAKLDGAPIATGAAIVVRAGPHRLTTEHVGGAPESRDLVLEGDQLATIELAMLTVTTPPREVHERALAPAWAITAGALTAVLGGAAIASGVDVAGRHDDFVARGCTTLGGPGCNDDASAGRSAETRTNVLLGVTAVSALATGLAIWLATSASEGDAP